ncbi:hypothetical protein TRFO_38708 [Tritrichomonas foetus]|uniref:Sister chromatid cohesion protein DCC1 n=1 Tax=Tritrichomonas foetus TaxID=1144522 RepID=A0A1J4J779_9EUKA|nr:hypothetical protein TRFO_38708 [Tritrichomonas foetus]|eukprot:OHS95090.1 hypothetical protein TRFO_38708 [Tritrichomonas foetus]
MWLTTLKKIDGRLKIKMEEYVFDQDYQEDKFLLFEFPSEEFLQGVLKGDTKIEFVSNEKDPIVLCTEQKTYDILEFDTSNILLICDEQYVLSGNTSTFELRDKQPPFLLFRRMMHAAPITVSEIKGETIENPIYFDDLAKNTLCSKNEFNQILTDICAITVGRILKTPPKDLKDLIINQVLQYSRTVDDWRCINQEKCLEAINIPFIEYPVMKSIYYAVVKYYAFEIKDDEVVLDEKKVMRHIAEYAFKNARNGFISKNDFEREMDDHLPTGTKLNKELLYGMFVTKDRGYQYIDEETLPIDLIERFNELFRIHEQWEVHEIEPFFEYFITDSLPFIDLAARHCRFANGKWMHR